MGKPRFEVDFNEMVSDNICLLSQTDKRADASGHIITLREGMEVDVFMEDLDEDDNPDPLIASGIAQHNTAEDWSKHVKWVVVIDEKGIRPKSRTV
jgi:hypothetical protein